MKTFTAISAIIDKDKLVILATSNGLSLYNKHGITFEQAIDFLFMLRYCKGKDEVFICYAFQSDNEFLFSQLPDNIKDRLFQSHSVRKLSDELHEELDEIEYQFYNADKDTQDFEELDFNKHVNKLALQDLVEVQYYDYDIRLINGKLLSLSKDHKRFILFDVYGFFRTTLKSATKTWLDTEVKKLDRRETLTQDSTLKELKAFALFEARQIVKLMTRLNDTLLENNINLSRFHGVTTISSWLLSKTKARKEFHSYKRRRQYSGELYSAVYQAYYGGRVEQFKIGTFEKGVHVYDLNSAYAYASSLLPQMLQKPDYAPTWNNEPFSLWYCEYDFTGVDSYFGLMPNRDAGNFIKYKMRGKGYFWQPEIQYILENYPQCIQVKHGYYIPYVKANFTNAILELYDIRLKLQALGHPLEKVIKLALSAIYGKFCQRDGYSYYHNMFYAGYITSITRMELLRATKSEQHKVICFLTDAIHSTSKLSIQESNDLGAWKRTEYSKAQYLDAGIYRLYDMQNEVAKLKTKGFRYFDFDNALTELEQFRVYTALNEIFIGHNLHSFMPLRFREYLKLQKETKQSNPFGTSERMFDTAGIDLTKTHCESKALDYYSGRESNIYTAKHYREADLSLDSITAEKLI